MPPKVGGAQVGLVARRLYALLIVCRRSWPKDAFSKFSLTTPLDTRFSALQPRTGRRTCTDFVWR